nr:reverse transcriptase domain-containing protein [Tanacetum cinerariifolium]
MSSPNHHTSNIEDAFSYNFLDYILTSSDYVPASPGKTYSSSLNNSFGLVPIASPNLSLFYDDPYMKVMHAYYAKESPIPPPVIMSPSLMLSPMFNPQELFLPEELLPPKKRKRDRSSSSTPTLPQEFDIREISHKTSLERHKEQIEEILNHLDELSLNRIENMEDNIEGLGKGRVIIQQDFDNLETELQETRAQVAKLQRKKLGQNKKIDLDRFRITDLEQIIKEIQAPPAMTQATIRKLVADSITTALEAQAANMENADNTNRNPKPREAHVAKKCSYKKFMSCQPFNFKSSEGVVGLIHWFKRTESVFLGRNYTEGCKGNDLKTYVRRFQELAILCPTMVSDSKKMIGAFIEGLPQKELSTTTTTVTPPPTTATIITNHNRTKDKKPSGPCTVKCNTCNKVGHMTRNCNNKGPSTGSNLLSVTVTYHACGEKGHYANQCQKTTNNNAQGRAYTLRDRNAHQNPNVVTDLPGLPPVRQVEFQIDLIPRAAPVARAPYRLAPLEMQKLSDQLQDQRLHVDPAKIKAVNNYASPTTPTEIRQFLGLAGYYRRFIDNFSKIAKSLTELTQKNKKYIWGEDQETAFQLHKQKLCEASILALPEGNDDFIVYSDASHQGIIRFKKQGKLNPQYIGPFKILKRIGLVAYNLELPEELSNVHSTFHISNLKKCLSDESLVIPIKELRLDDKLNFMEEPVEVMDREVKGEYSQWRKRFMKYLKEQTDGEAMINSIQNGDQPLPVIAQVS